MEGNRSMNFEDFTIQAKDGYHLSARLFDCAQPKAVVKIIHGMEEHKERYDEFASFLQKNGFAVLSADLRGHGKNAPLLSHIADQGGDRLLEQDEKTLAAWLNARYPDRKRYLFAHSMGTIIARKLMQENSSLYDKVVLSGYPVPQKVASAGIILSNLTALAKGDKKAHSSMVTNLAMGGFSKAVKNAKTPLDWLSYNEENVKNYQENPLCGVDFTLGSFETLFRLVRDIANVKLYRNVREDLPILLISGEDDPCTGGEKGRKTSLNVLSAAGFRNLKVETLHHMRHEILQENGHEKVYQMVLEFLS